MRLLTRGFFLQIDCHCLNHRNLLRFLFANKQVKVGKHVEVVTRFMDEVQDILDSLKRISNEVYYIRADVSVESEAMMLVNETVKQLVMANEQAKKIYDMQSKRAS